MPTVDVVVESGVNLSVRARQVCGMFDCPPQDKQRIEWRAEMPIEDRDWSVGLLVGPSGSGKTTIANSLWPEEMNTNPTWDGETLIDCFSAGIEDTSYALNAVGFNTIPAWLRPYRVLSNGEKFRAEMARRIVEQDGLIVVDEFTSVVDRQVAQIASHAIQKYIRRSGKKLIAMSCHDDIIDWLQPDWIFRPDERSFSWRSVQPRPRVDIEVARLPYEAWGIFAPYHYMSAELHKAARCYGAWVNGNLAAFAGVMHKPHPKTKNLKGVSRLVTLPDYQGLGVAFVLSETVASAYKALGFRYRHYPAHPMFVRAHRENKWRMMKRVGKFSNRAGRNSTITTAQKQRPCAVMEYIGEAMSDKEEARKLIWERKT